MRPDPGTYLCAVKDVPYGKAKGVSLPLHPVETHNSFEVIIWHHHDGIRAFENKCPHLGTPLETFPDRFLNAEASALNCSTHGALFDKTGHCFAGPCLNKSLPTLAIKITNGNILLA